MVKRIGMGYKFNYAAWFTNSNPLRTHHTIPRLLSLKHYLESMYDDGGHTVE